MDMLWTATRQLLYYAICTATLKFGSNTQVCFLRKKKYFRPNRKRTPLHYLANIDLLISELRNSCNSMCLFNESMCAPTVADDMVNVAFKQKDFMLNIRFNYSKLIGSTVQKLCCQRLAVHSEYHLNCNDDEQ